MSKLFDLLKFEEGYRERVYYCSEHYPTIGIGTKLGSKNAPLEHYTFTVSEKVAKAMLDDEVSSIVKLLVGYRWYTQLDENRQTIIKSMAYQMGVSGLLKFRNMIAALEAQDWQRAHDQALDSRWARQTPKRANRHADVLLTGDLESVYGGLL
jgi:lysozyme